MEPFDVGREKSILAIEKAMEENGEVFLVMQRCFIEIPRGICMNTEP